MNAPRSGSARKAGSPKRPKVSNLASQTPKWRSLSLWPNQIEALKVCDTYLSHPERAALVQMPTGTGKTGVIAVLSSSLSGHGIVIVVSPSKALSAQLALDIKTDFWQKINAPKEWKPSSVLDLLPSNEALIQKAIDASEKSVVLVGTLQALQQIRDEKENLYDNLAAKTAAILVDEGHREPAPQWAEAVRGLAKPSVLFSATPYRNDLKLFDVSDESIYFLSFQQAVESHLIRDVIFQELQTDGRATTFVSSVIAAYDDLRSRNRISPDAKVIVRCATEADVLAIHDALKKQLSGRKEKYVAIHDRFAGVPPTLLENVPQLRNRPEVFLVHQFKLMEGMDEPRCQVLAIFQNFTNERQLVQQIGRVIRHPNPRHGLASPAVILAGEIPPVRDMWNAYLAFDAACQSAGKPPVRNSKEIVRKLLEALPSNDYVGGRFRTRVDFDEIQPEDIIVQKSCVAFATSGNFVFESLRTTLREALEYEDRIILREGRLPNEDCHFFLTLELQQSSLLSDSSFPNVTLHATVVRFVRGYLFFHDTGGLWIDDLSKHLRRVDAGTLRCLLPEHDKTRITSLTVLNADIGPSALRSRTLTAASIADAAPFMGDNLHSVSRAAGLVPAGDRRYIGFGRARVRQDMSRSSTLRDFSEWTDRISRELYKALPGTVLFSRFASPATPPSDVAPLNILIDVAGLEEIFIDEAGRELDMSDVCSEVSELANPYGRFTHEFAVIANDKRHKIFLRYDDKRHKYILRSTDLDTYTDAANPRVTLTKRLNRGQAFRVVPRVPGIVYAWRQFYSIDLNLKTGAGSVAIDLLTPLAELGGVTSEKGFLVGDFDDWPNDSLFGLIDRALRPGKGSAPFGDRFTAVVCEDLGNEAADFIGIDEGEQRVAFVHAKHHADPTFLSSSSLYDICGQAVKNLGFLRFGSRDLPGSAGKWNGSWKISRKDVGTFVVRKRLRGGASTAADFRDRLKRLLANPNTKRETWLVLGSILSANALKTGISRENASANLLQSFYLFMSTYSNCKSVGVDLKIFCNT